ncbi:MAG: dihydroorotate dehydrogenase [Planctomycetota bacterium]|nr:dihydroorotate dehydrogenase [Planctomycetota bacterium]
MNATTTQAEAPPEPAVDLSVELGPLKLANPIGTGSGTYGKGVEFQSFYDVARLGCVVVKTITVEERAGNPPPRLAETAGGLLNSIGLQNPGVERYIAEVLPKLRTLGAPLVINIAGHTVEAFGELAAAFGAEEGIAALELNMSCPNVSGGLDYSTDPKVAHEVVARAKDVTDLPLIAKLSPNVTDIVPIGLACQEAGATAVSAINTYVGMAIDWRKRKPILGRGFGGLSGPCIKVLALRLVHRLYQALDIPVIGIGGIQTADDVMEYLVAGATAVQVGTANFYRPNCALEIVEALPGLIRELGATSVRDVVGTLEMPG